MAYQSPFSNPTSLFADQYALTMAAADFNAGQIDRTSTSQVFFRDLINNGFKNAEGKDLKIPYLVVGGLGPVMEWLDGWKITPDDATWLASVKAPGGERLFSDPFIQHLEKTPLKVSVDAFPEGELAFPDEPILRLSGPHYQVEMLEAAVLNIVTAHTGWATVASQFWLAAQREDKQAQLYEFGARRTNEWLGIGSSRSAYLAGWAGTSNLLAGKTYGIPTAGTMAHAFVMVRENEIEAFSDWAKNMPHLGVFLVDTYDTLEGIEHAIEVCKKTGVNLRGIRLDSGDMTYLSQKGREILDKAGFEKAAIMASDSLGIMALHQIFQVQKAPLDSFGIGGNYVGRRQDTTGISAVMKVARVGTRDLMKYSNTPTKATLPGVLDVIRYFEMTKGGQKFFAGDTIIPHGMDIGHDKLEKEIISIPRHNHGGVKPFPRGVSFYRPIVSVMKDGEPLLPEFKDRNAPLVLQKARAQFTSSMALLEPSHKEILCPHLYGVGVEASLIDKQNAMVRSNAIEAQRRAQEKRFALQHLQNT